MNTAYSTIRTVANHRGQEKRLMMTNAAVVNKEHSKKIAANLLLTVSDAKRDPDVAVYAVRATPRPKQSLKIMEPKIPATAILVLPDRANAVSATRSPTQFPH